MTLEVTQRDRDLYSAIGNEGMLESTALAFIAEYRITSTADLTAENESLRARVAELEADVTRYRTNLTHCQGRFLNINIALSSGGSKREAIEIADLGEDCCKGYLTGVWSDAKREEMFSAQALHTSQGEVR